jgi:nucleoside-diphosphate-sugar epimerase
VPARGLNIGNHEPVPLLAMTGFAARASIDEGLGRFVAWYLDYYRVAR